MEIGSDILGTGHSFYVHIKYSIEISICPWNNIPSEAGITVLTFLGAGIQTLFLIIEQHVLLMADPSL